MFSVFSISIIYYVILFIFLYALYKFFCPYNLEKKYGFPGPPPIPLLGNYLDYSRKGYHVCDKENQKKYGHIYPTYLGRIPIMVVSDQTVLLQILVKDSESFIDRPKNTASAKLMKKDLFQLKGKDWERVRKIVSPTFSTGNLKKMSPMIIESIKYLMKRFNAEKEMEIDLKKIFGSLTMNVLAKTMFGIDLDKDPSNKFVEHATKCFNISLQNPLKKIMCSIPFLTPIVEWFYPRGIVSPTSMEFFEKSLIETILLRRSQLNDEHDFLNQMLKAHNGLIREPLNDEQNTKDLAKGRLTEEEIMAQSIVFLLAGFEATSLVLSSCVYYLTMNQEVQEEAYQELVDKLPQDEPITYDMIHDIKVLERCLQETLRMCPPVLRIQRLCVKDTSITTSTKQVLNIKKGMIFAVPIYAIHNDEAIWEECDKFDMRRFNPEEIERRDKFTFLPFGKGPRICLGQRFALLEAKLALVHLMLKIKFIKCNNTPERLTFRPSRLTKIVESIVIRVELR